MSEGARQSWRDQLHLRRRRAIQRLSNSLQRRSAPALYLTDCSAWRVPPDWAMSFGNEGVALMLLAERRGGHRHG
jgi:hypothetical protein